MADEVFNFTIGRVEDLAVLRQALAAAQHEDKINPSDSEWNHKVHIEQTVAERLIKMLEIEVHVEALLREKYEGVEEVLHSIKQWCDAYPLDVFPEPDFKKAAALLEAGGMTIDAISASNMRHVLKGISKLIPEFVPCPEP